MLSIALAACSTPHAALPSNDPRHNLPPTSVATTSLSGAAPTPQSNPALPLNPPIPPGGSIIDRKLFDTPQSFDAGGLAIDSHHNRYIVGVLSGVATFGDLTPITADRSDAVILKLDHSNKPLWVRCFGGSGSDFAQSVVVDGQDNVFVSGAFNSPTIDIGGTILKNAGVHDLFLTKVSSEGNFLWAKRYGDSQDQIDLHLRSDEKNGVIATGWFNGTLEMGAGPFHSPLNKSFFVARIGPDGNALWNRTFGHRHDFATTDSSVDRNGDIVVSGASDGIAEFVPNGHPSSKDDLGPVLLRLDETGKPIFEKRFGRGADNLTTQVGIDSKGNIRLATTSVAVTTFGGDEKKPADAQQSLIVTSFDTKGSVLWTHDILTSPMLSVQCVRIDGNGNTLVAGQFDDHSQFRMGTREDGYVFKISEDGHVLWSLDIMERGQSSVTAVAIDTDGTILALGDSSNLDDTHRENQLWITTLQP